MWTLLYEYSGDVRVHEALAGSRGLCAAHGELVAEIVGKRQLASAGAVARLYLTVVNSVREKLRRSSRRLPVPRCPLCSRSEETARHLAWTLAGALRSGAWRGAYQASDGLCLPHLDMCLSGLRGEARAWLVQDTSVRLDVLAESLSELCRKQRYDVHDKMSEQEGMSWREALWRIGGS